MEEDSSQDGFPMYVRGDWSIFSLMDFCLDMTIILERPHIIKVNIKPIKLLPQQNHLNNFTPTVQIEVFNESQRESIIKHKHTLKENILYIYLPVSIRVDDNLYKLYQANFDNMLKEIPRNLRHNFTRFILFDGKTKDSSVDIQKAKINETLSNVLRNIIDKKLELINQELNSLSLRELNSNVLMHIFLLKNKKAEIFTQLKLISNSLEVLDSVWNTLLLNHKHMLKNKSNMAFEMPFLTSKMDKVIEKFEDPSCFLIIVDYSFFEMFKMSLRALQEYQAMTKLAYFIDDVLKKFFSGVLTLKEDLVRNAWVVDIVDQAYKLLDQTAFPPIMNTEKESGCALTHIAVRSQHRMALERIGIALYGLNTYSIFPTNLVSELRFCLDQFQHPERQETLQSKVSSEQMELLIGSSECPIMDTFASFKSTYLRSLYEIYKKLQKSVLHQNVAWSMKLSVLKVIIKYFSIQSGIDKHIEMIEQVLGENDRRASCREYNIRADWPWYSFELLLYLYKLILCEKINYQQPQPLLRLHTGEVMRILFDYNLVTFNEWQAVAEKVKPHIHKQTTLISQKLQGHQCCLIGSIESQAILQNSSTLLRLTLHLSNAYFDNLQSWLQAGGTTCANLYLLIQKITSQGHNNITKLRLTKVHLTNSIAECHLEEDDTMVFRVWGFGIELIDHLFYYTFKESQEVIRFNSVKLKNASNKEKQQIIYTDLWTPVVYQLQNMSGKLSIKQLEFSCRDLVPIVITQKIKNSAVVQLRRPGEKPKQQEFLFTEKSLLEFELTNLDTILITVLVKATTEDKVANAFGRARLLSNVSASRSLRSFSIDNIPVLTAMVDIQHNSYAYTLKQDTSYTKESALVIFYCYLRGDQLLEEFTIKNIGYHQMAIKEIATHDSSFKQNLYQGLLRPWEELKLINSKVQLQIIGITDTPPEVLQLKEQINPDSLQPKETGTCSLTVVPSPDNHYHFKKFDIIAIRSDTLGNVTLIKQSPHNQGTKAFEFVGKIEGDLTYTDDTNSIDLWIVPVKSGKLVLPTILIDRKKGVWKDRFYIQIE